MLAAGTVLLNPTQDPPAPFAVASIHFEQNASDGDFEAVVEVKGGDEGLAQLAVVSPDGRAVIDVTAPAATTLGVRQLRFESPEPGDFASLKSAYPEGVYSFTGATADGTTLQGKATLRHTLPPAAAFLRPAAGARTVSVKDLVITWTAVRNVTAYIVTIEQHGSDVSITARLAGSVASFAVPDGFLRPGTAYQLGIGTVTAGGNISFVETTFTTAE
ncbi:MAG TPA: hypothetical protein VFO67_01275 [Gemmatimonadales bacterium]|nr:hypothetical protein [Gemmatimonadales bacterium]